MLVGKVVYLRCRALLSSGERCLKEASCCGLCMTHFKLTSL